MAQIRTQQAGNQVRIGPISVLTLIAVICMAVLAVLAISTATASLTMSQKQADAVSQLYVDEIAAQAFVAEADAELAGVRKAGGSGDAGSQAVAGSLTQICQDANEAAGGSVNVTAGVTGRIVSAEFSCDDQRILSIELEIYDDATYRVEKWKMAAVQNEEQPGGSLWSGA